MAKCETCGNEYDKAFELTIEEEAAADEKLTSVAEGNVNPSAVRLAAK